MKYKELIDADEIIFYRKDDGCRFIINGEYVTNSSLMLNHFMYFDAVRHLTLQSINMKEHGFYKFYLVSDFNKFTYFKEPGLYFDYYTDMKGKHDTDFDNEIEINIDFVDVKEIQDFVNVNNLYGIKTVDGSDIQIIINDSLSKYITLIKKQKEDYLVMFSTLLDEVESIDYKSYGDKNYDAIKEFILLKSYTLFFSYLNKEHNCLEILYKNPEPFEYKDILGLHFRDINNVLLQINEVQLLSSAFGLESIKNCIGFIYLKLLEKFEDQVMKEGLLVVKDEV